MAGDEDRKIPAAVTFVADDRLRNLTFSARNNGHGVDIKIGDAVVSAFANQLAVIFKTVEVAESPKKSNDSDLIANLNFRWIQTERDSWSGDLSTYRFGTDGS
jgi:hypothetical protein